MEKTENKNNQSKSDQARNNVITIKVSAKEKAKLQQLADDVDLTISEFLRLKGLSTQSSIVDFEEALHYKEEEIRKLKIALAFYEGNKIDTPGIALPMTEIQAHELYMIFSNYYDNITPFEKQIIRYLLEDLFTPHYQFEKKSILDISLSVQNALTPVKVEVPIRNSINYSHLAEVFREYGTFDFEKRVLNQLKAPSNKRIIEVWKQSEE